MREHLALCFDCEEISSFPVTSSSRHVRSGVEEDVELFCHCRLPYDDCVFMVECFKCKGWFHRSCDKVPKKVTAKTTFTCKKCQ